MRPLRDASGPAAWWRAARAAERAADAARRPISSPLAQHADGSLRSGGTSGAIRARRQRARTVSGCRLRARGAARHGPAGSTRSDSARARHGAASSQLLAAVRPRPARRAQHGGHRARQTGDAAARAGRRRSRDAPLVQPRSGRSRRAGDLRASAGGRWRQRRPPNRRRSARFFAMIRHILRFPPPARPLLAPSGVRRWRVRQTACWGALPR